MAGTIQNQEAQQTHQLHSIPRAKVAAEGRPADHPMITSHDRLVRLATLAAETGARFARERVEADPVAWMTMPHRLFDGRTAIEASQNAVGLGRGLLLHRLSLGLDASPEQVDALAKSGITSFADIDGINEFGGPDDSDGVGQDGTRGGIRSPSVSRKPVLWAVPGSMVVRLFTATIVERSKYASTHVFYAATVATMEEFKVRLSRRVGEPLAWAASIAEGFDPSHPIAMALVSDSMANMLALLAGEPDQPLGHGLDVLLEQRFDS